MTCDLEGAQEGHLSSIPKPYEIYEYGHYSVYCFSLHSDRLQRLRVQPFVAREPFCVGKRVVCSLLHIVVSELRERVLEAIVQHGISRMVLNVDVCSAAKQELGDTLEILLRCDEQERIAIDVERVDHDSFVLLCCLFVCGVWDGG